MPDEVILDVTTIEENVTVETTAGDVVEIQVVAPTGTAATVTVGTTTTGAAGTNASVTNSGTTSAAVLNFTIPQGAAGANGGSSTAWKYKAKTNATSGYPTNGHLLWNNATQLSATEILVSHLNDDGSDIELFLSFFVEGQKLFIQNRDDSSQNQIWEITGTPTVTNQNTSTSYYTFPVTLVSSQGASFNNSHLILFGTITEATNSVTSATTSDGTATLSIADLEVVGGEIYTDGDYSSIYTQGATAHIFTLGSGAEIYTEGELAQIYTTGASAQIYTAGAGATIGTQGANATIYTQGTNATISTAGSAAHIQTSHASAAVKSTNFAAVESGGASLVDGSMQPCLTWSAGGRNLTIPSGTATTFNATSYTYGTGAAAAHRTALGLDSLFNDKANLSGGNSFSGAQTIATTGATAALALSTTSTSSSIVLETALAASATGTTSIAVGRALTTNNAAIFGHGASYAYAHVQGRTAADFNVQSSGNVCIGTTTDNNAFGGAKLQVRGQGSSTANWRGRIVAGGDNAVFLMGEYNSGAWLGAHNGSLSAWADMYIQAQGGKDLCIAYDGASFYANSRIITGATLAMGTASPNARALIDMTSTTKGFLPPRMNTTQRDAISSPPAGLMIYNTTLNKLNVYNGTAWETVTSL